MYIDLCAAGGTHLEWVKWGWVRKGEDWWRLFEGLSRAEEAGEDLSGTRHHKIEWSFWDFHGLFVRILSMYGTGRVWRHTGEMGIPDVFFSDMVSSRTRVLHLPRRANGRRRNHPGGFEKEDGGGLGAMADVHSPIIFKLCSAWRDRGQHDLPLFLGTGCDLSSSRPGTRGRQP